MSFSAPELAATTASFVRDRMQTAARVWFALTLSGSAIIALLDTALLQRKYNFFTGGFLTAVHLDSPAERVAFFVASVAVNCWLIAPFTAIGLLMAERLRLDSRAAQFLALAIGVLPLAVADFLAYEVWAYLGNAFDFELLFALTGWRPSEVFAVIAPLLARPASLALGAMAAVIAVTWVLQRLSRRSLRAEAPSLRNMLRGCVGCLVLASGVAFAASFSGEAVQWGFRKVAAAQPLVRAFERLSDFDGDGYGVVGRLPDPAPFNAALHPYALEIAGNGVDEDGVAGDLPLDRTVYREGLSPAAAWGDRPPVVLFVLESFRADVIGARHQGQPVTPVLDAVARDGFKIESAWSHNGFTSQSRFHVLTGSLAGLRQGTSLLDDFKDHGYEVAYFSAQDDSFGATPVRYDRVDTYYDARQDVENRYTRYTTPGSLAVPAHILEKRIRDYLDARRRTEPLFLYVNFHDTHFPYVHASIQNLLNVNTITPAQISPERRDDLRVTYLNTVANVDRAIGNVLNAVTAQVGRRPAVIVVSDHGESLFDEGFLGHGYALNDAQTRIPLIVSNLAVKMRIPFGQVDLRDLVNGALAAGESVRTTPPAATNDGKVFQYLGPLDTPAQIAWLTSSGRLIYDFRVDEVSIDNRWVEPGMLSGEAQRLFRDLIYTWEGMRLERARLSAGRGTP